jgi:hypothetical protein
VSSGRTASRSRYPASMRTGTGSALGRPKPPGRQGLQPGQQRPAQLVQSGVRELALELPADRPYQPQAIGTFQDAFEQLRLADARLAADHDRAAPPGGGGAHALLDRCQLRGAREEPGRA